MLGRAGRIKTLLVIDSFFFLLEIIVGYSVGSLALVADSFHMLNDVCSLLVALYAIKLASQHAPSAQYSYGWQRAEVLGALINGVFLLALCFSICLEAISRIFQPQEVGSPRLVVIVGSLGLLSNLVGLVLFHEHGHSHSHSHSHHSNSETSPKALESSKSKHRRSHSGHRHSLPNETTPLLIPPPSPSTTSETVIPIADSDSDSDSQSNGEEESSIEALLVHPSSLRDHVIRKAKNVGYGSLEHQGTSAGKRGSWTRNRSKSGDLMNSQQNRRRNSSVDRLRRLEEEVTKVDGDSHGHEHEHEEDGHRDEHDGHHEHSHGHGHEHSHGSMNMQGVFLHVLGDALGNIGVIGSGLVIWLTSWEHRYLLDPLSSLIITIIIFSSTLPLVKSASFILLQGVPHSIPLDIVRDEVCDIEGVLGVHELHIWSLSEEKIIASCHVLVASRDQFISISREIRKVMHRWGIHSSTIQPEVHEGDVAGLETQTRVSGRGELVRSITDKRCVMPCVNKDCKSCCPPVSVEVAR